VRQIHGFFAGVQLAIDIRCRNRIVDRIATIGGRYEHLISNRPAPVQTTLECVQTVHEAEQAATFPALQSVSHPEVFTIAIA